ncbi:formate dehydrogenase accessory sulfurtransferase FdhD [Sinorhizobium medicae]|uniref:Sulfur carrier protein FdhD n=1 Tax=Sinorhizobium medicae TaxID=110321 RepID=A0A6G1WNV0_9HYPH|nr:formate dehydrogenase accessory sulfurtransferase FdhD [Sinorhizobium medicae]MQV99953.1 formate dehydrogenase accessory sulfurtransferase FdhD [Sinorhizobium medicae]MQW71440.1 formate dehydrogenase accessory sulfurtransferase FdhD [Sinorhizobium medicae]MQX84637.1 formate dehydrogenase accessory sulfurtransferase FdhD [Sinorhizobium medicae]RVJ78325.1 formate dehydrogenase accessory sulfurtransferase FdhD [Sinorhizobium medicae]
MAGKRVSTSPTVVPAGAGGAPRPGTTATVAEAARRGGIFVAQSRVVPEEMPVAFTYGGSTHAVMMATPADLEDFATGFSLTEGIITGPEQIDDIDIVAEEKGIDLQIRLKDEQNDALRLRRRHMAGPVGCGLCGIESIDEAVRPTPDVSGSLLRLSEQDVVDAVALLNGQQPLHFETRAVHGAAFYVPGRGLIAVREDVGRHNALDKLTGAAARAGFRGAQGAVVVTSRVSVEMVQKTAIAGSPVIIAISAPTALAIRTAEGAGMTLIALVRGDEFEIFTHAERIARHDAVPASLSACAPLF